MASTEQAEPASAEAGDSENQGEARTRSPSGWLGHAVRAITIGLGLYILAYISTLFQWLDISLYGSHRALTYAVILFLLFVFYPISRNGPWDRTPWYDLLLGAVGAFCALYAFVSWNDWLDGVGIPLWYEEIFGVVLVLITLEGSRRALGPAFTLVAVVFIVYPIIGPYLPGVLQTRHNTLSALVQNYYFAGTTDGIFGSPMEIFTTTVAVFLLFGSFLQATGAAKVFLDGALGLAGAFRAGNGQGSGNFLGPVRHDQRRWRRQCAGDRQLHHSGDEEDGLSRTARRGGGGSRFPPAAS